MTEAIAIAIAETYAKPEPRGDEEVCRQCQGYLTFTQGVERCAFCGLPKGAALTWERKPQELPKYDVSIEDFYPAEEAVAEPETPTTESSNASNTSPTNDAGSRGHLRPSPPGQHRRR